LAGIAPLTTMIIMLRRGAPMMPHLTLALAALAVAAIVNLGLLLFHVGDVSIMVLVWHVGVVIAVSAVASLAGPMLLRWQHASV
jgi:hypothetical protein